MKKFLIKINPFNYKENPIGAFKTELCFHIVLLVLFSYLSGGTFILNQIDSEYPIVPFWLVLSFGVISWGRLATLVSTRLDKDINKENKEEN